MLASMGILRGLGFKTTLIDQEAYTQAKSKLVQISSADGCLISGWSVSRAPPNFTKFLAVYLEQNQGFEHSDQHRMYNEIYIYIYQCNGKMILITSSLCPT
jgi:hypothetical protein